MRFWVGITDTDWFRFLAARQPDEVNFWQPGGGRPFKVLQPGGLFLFKLHSPDNYIVGGGFFLRHTSLPMRLAWEAFGEKNGVASQAAFRERIARYRRDDSEINPTVGCIVLVEPFFFHRDDWIPVPKDWAPNIVTGKSYDSTEGDGAGLFEQVQTRLEHLRPAVAEDGLATDDQPRYGEYFLTRARLGQGSFQVLVTDAYSRRCAVTGERTLPTLEAAHIKPYSESGPHRVDNGMLLRSDWHRLFDDGYVTVTPELRIEVSGRIREEFENGREYYRHHGQSLTVMPEESWQRPDRDFIEYHNEQVYRG